MMKTSTKYIIYAAVAWFVYRKMRADEVRFVHSTMQTDYIVDSGQTTEWAK
jgi:hypothetical protein